ncbi:probable cytochrome P450 308a1 [Topomyia yanbarensis]|uniref:probable cytochrome P450 308a1 n=1 Tax=Topomyia yanbarensis TaxID=2498891 RepID=UPI00273B0BA3|nr:probable cytochrome P450 308a1 [Topomyia yanbarensis]
MIELCVALGVLTICLFFKWSCSYWRRVGNIDGPQPLPLFGNSFEQVIGRKHFGEIYEEVYRTYPNASWVGVYELLNKPAIVVRDLELVKEILVSNLRHFHKNLFVVDEKIDPLLAMNPFTQTGEQWKKSRSQVAPIFSTPKVRAAFPLIKNVAENLSEYVKNTRETNPDFEAKQMCAMYTIDVVACCAFGINAESFTNPDAEFRRMCIKVLNPSWIRSLLTIFAPTIAHFFKIAFVPKSVDQWFRDVIKEVIRQREDGEVKRHDLFQAMYDSLSKNGTVAVDSNEIVGHSVTFLTEGFETSSIMMSFFLYELASNRHIQDRVLNEIDRILEESDGHITDEAVQKLHYTERAMYETLRMHSAVFTLSKICSKEYELPAQYATDSKRVSIKPGMTAIIPVHAIHYDPEIYPEPYRFDPDRFLEENKLSRHHYAFLGFGEGPRICLGMKFALSQVKIGIVTLLAKYRVELSDKQQLPLEFERTSFMLTPKSGIWIKFVERS